RLSFLVLRCLAHVSRRVTDLNLTVTGLPRRIARVKLPWRRLCAANCDRSIGKGTMISLPGSAIRLCEGSTRREWLRAAGLSPLGLLLPDLLHAHAEAAGAVHRTARRPARACIVVFLFGAPAHQDIWDLKPEAPREVRGEFQPIATSVPGI